VVAAAVETVRAHQVDRVVAIIQRMVQLVQALQVRVFQVEQARRLERVAEVECRRVVDLGQHQLNYNQ
jgi:hypothetical protein